MLQSSLGQIGRVDQCLQDLGSISGSVGSIIQQENGLINDFQGRYQQMESQLSTVMGELRDSVELVVQIDAAIQTQAAASATLSTQLEEIAVVSGSLQEKMQLV